MNETIVLGGGCFWCTEAAFNRLKGVVSVRSGYAGGRVENPSYEQVSTGTTGHAEVVKVEYNPQEINVKDLLSVFLTIHDPTTLNRQGYDVGTQYRSIILYSKEEQKEAAQELIKELVSQGLWADKVVTEIKPLETFYEAEPEHYRYYELNKENRYCQVVIDPKLGKLRQKHAALLK